MAFLIGLLLFFATAGDQQRLRVVVIEGEGAVNIIQQKTAVAPVVEVRDQNNLPVAGAAVRFTIAGEKQAAFTSGTQTITVTTNAAGRAAAALNPLSNGAVQIQVQATFQGQTAAATIAQTNVMTAAQAGQAATAASGGGGGIGGGAIAGIAGGVGAAGAAAVLTRKSDTGDETSHPIDPAVQAALGLYVLQSVNGAGMPAITVASPPAACAVITDNATLTLSVTGSDQFYEVTESSRTDCRVGPSESFRSSSTGTWTLSGSTITFTPRSDNFLLDAATLSNGLLSMTVRPPHIEAGKEAPRVNTTWRK